MRDIPGYKGLYSACRDGRIYSHRRSNFLKLSDTEKGYKRVTLWANDRSRSFKVHRLVASAYLPNPNNYPEINHIDGVRTNNMIENLEWCTRTHNVQHAAARNSKKRTDKRIINLISLLLDEGVTVTTICEKANIKPSLVLSVVYNLNKASN